MKLKNQFSTVPPAQREAALIEKYSFIEDPQERLHALCSYRWLVVPVPEAECKESNLVRGCSSPVWLCGGIIKERLVLAMSSPTPLVSSLAGIVCDLCDGAAPSEIECWQPHWISGLRIDRHLSATRQSGLAAIVQRIREIAAADQPGRSVDNVS